MMPQHDRGDFVNVSSDEAARHRDSDSWVSRLCGTKVFESRQVRNCWRNYRHSERWSIRSERSQINIRIRSRCRVEWNGYPRHVWEEFLQQLDPLTRHRRFKVGETGGIAGGPRQTGDEALRNRVDDLSKDNRDGPCLLKQ